VSNSHTPGPWTVESATSEALHDIALAYQMPEAENPKLIATAYCDHEDVSYAGRISSIEAEANARLMALAPEMLAVLEECVCLGALDLLRDAPAIAAARAIVAKAKGKS